MARILAKGIVPRTVGRSSTSINVLMVTAPPPQPQPEEILDSVKSTCPHGTEILELLNSSIASFHKQCLSTIR